MIINEGNTPTYQAIIASFNASLFGDTSIPAIDVICGGDGESEDEMMDYRRRLKGPTDPTPNHPDVNRVSNESAADIPLPPPPHTLISATPSVSRTPTASSSIPNIMDTDLAEPEPEEQSPEPKKRPGPRKKAPLESATNSLTPETPEAMVDSAKVSKKSKKKTTTAGQPTTQTLRQRG